MGTTVDSGRSKIGDDSIVVDGAGTTGVLMGPTKKEWIDTMRASKSRSVLSTRSHDGGRRFGIGAKFGKKTLKRQEC